MYDKIPQPVAVVTGGASGLGAAFVERLVGHGYAVAVLDRADSDSAVGNDHVLRQRGDVTRPDDVARFADRVRAELGPPQVLVNNVGASPYRTFEEETVETWREVMAVNVESCVITIATFLDDLVKRPHARIVNLCSSVLWDAEARGMVAYTAAKGAVLGLTRSLASELGPRGVTVNAIAPGIVRTPDTVRVPEEKLARYLERQSIPYIAEPADLLSSLDYLVGPESDYVTGLVLGVNGGRVWL